MVHVEMTVLLLHTCAVLQQDENKQFSFPVSGRNELCV